VRFVNCRICTAAARDGLRPNGCSYWPQNEIEGRMTIPLERLKARLLADPDVKAEYDALALPSKTSAQLTSIRPRAPDKAQSKRDG